MIRMIMSREEQLHLAATIKAERDRKLQELGNMIRGTPAGIGPGTKGASVVVKNNPKPRKKYWTP